MYLCVIMYTTKQGRKETMKSINKIMNKIDDIIMADLTEKIMLTMAHVAIVVGVVALIVALVK